MGKLRKAFQYLILGVFIFRPGISYTQVESQFKLDPSLLISLKECQNITEHIQFYPDWDFEKTPILFYRPGVQEVLINFPYKPDGFKALNTNLLQHIGSSVYCQDSTFTMYDDQNTSIEIDSIPVLVVADPWSRMRNQIRNTVFNYSDDFINDWFEKCFFIPSPYDEIKLILHEAFHVHQAKKAPEKYADERIVSDYPILDPVNNALYVLEAYTLRDIFQAKSSDEKDEKIRQFVAVRSYRQSLLDKEIVDYENRNEYVEGTAKYIEYKFLTMDATLEPIREMYYRNGFSGYENTLDTLFAKEVDEMVKIVSVSDDRFSNKYGTGPMRFRLYFPGACEALILDDLYPVWKNIIFDDNVYLFDLIEENTKLSSKEKKALLEQVKEEYDYPEILESKLMFEKEGKAIIKKKTDEILNSENTLVKIHYGYLTDSIRMAYTPFGVTKISETANIYDMVPIAVGFKTGIVLRMKQTIPVIVDKVNKYIAFSINSEILKQGITNEIDVKEFSLSGTKMQVDINQKSVNIDLIEE